MASLMAALRRCGSSLRTPITPTPARHFSRRFGPKTDAPYLSLPADKRSSFVPPPSDDIKDPASFLAAIGRDCTTVASKFKDWNHLFLASSSEMESLGIKTRMRKYILCWKEWYRRGQTPHTIQIPKRQKKYIKVREAVKRARLERLGMI